MIYSCIGTVEQADWNSFKGNIGETSEGWGGVHMGFSEGIDTMLNRMQACLANTHRLHEMTISKVKSGLRYSVQVNGGGGFVFIS